jgi:hypothetical protein
MNWFPELLVLHIALAISLLAPSLLLPFLLRRQPVGAGPGSATRALMAMQGTGSLAIGAALALTGIGLVISLGTEILTKPWLLVALLIYALNLLLAAFISRPGLRRLVRLRSTDAEGWGRQAARVRYAAYAMGAATLLIGFLMSTKPRLW